MNYEEMKIKARVLLMGKRDVGSMLIFFLFFLRVAVKSLAVLVVANSSALLADKVGRVFFALGIVTVVSGFLLAECTCFVVDKWFLCVAQGTCRPVVNLLCAFRFSDFLAALKFGAVNRFYVFTRYFVFVAFPIAFAAFSILAVTRGVSVEMFCVLAAGSAVLITCGLCFALAAVSCVGVSRTVCVGGKNIFRNCLASVERYVASLFFYSLTLGFSGVAYRRMAKLIFAQQVFQNNITADETRVLPQSVIKEI